MPNVLPFTGRACQLAATLRLEAHPGVTQLTITDQDGETRELWHDVDQIETFLLQGLQIVATARAMGREEERDGT